MAKILVVEDDLALSAGLCFALDEAGHLTAAAYTCQKARQLLKTGQFDLVILDVNLPDGNDHTLTVTINRLRAKIEDAGHTYIQTVRGMGYVWTGAQV